VRLTPFLLVLLLASCGGGDQGEAPSELVGVVTAVQGSPAVESFTLDADGDVYTIHIASDVDYGFDLVHLHEHRTTGEPVRCVLEQRGERLYALEIVDAPVI
jgi:hypothetical protein